MADWDNAIVHRNYCLENHVRRRENCPTARYICICSGAPRDNVNHPPHYTRHPSGVECIDIVEHMSFNLGNAIKYIWRAGQKADPIGQDLQKAVWYLNREIERLTRDQKHQAEESATTAVSAEG